MKRKPILKAFFIIPWRTVKGDDHYYTGSDRVIYADTASKAKYKYYLHTEQDDEGWFKNRVVRAKDSDLYAPEPAEEIATLTKNQIEIIKGAYGFNSRSPGYRNHFAAGSKDDGDCRVLVTKKIMKYLAERSKTAICPDELFCLTDYGKEVVASMLPIKKYSG